MLFYKPSHNYEVGKDHNLILRHIKPVKFSIHNIGGQFFMAQNEYGTFYLPTVAHCCLLLHIFSGGASIWVRAADQSIESLKAGGLGIQL